MYADGNDPIKGGGNDDTRENRQLRKLVIFNLGKVI